MPNKSRDKGLRYEHELLSKYRPIFPNILTSRNASKYTDYLWVDFVNTNSKNDKIKLLIQAKNYKNYSSSQMIENIKTIEKNFKEEVKKDDGGDGNWGWFIPVIHCKNTNKRRNIVVIREEDFLGLIKS